MGTGQWSQKNWKIFLFPGGRKRPSSAVKKSEYINAKR